MLGRSAYLAFTRRTVSRGAIVRQQKPGVAAAAECGKLSLRVSAVMRVRRLILRASITGALFLPIASPTRSVAQTPQARPVSVADDSDKAIASLRQIANDLDDAVKLFQMDLDREMALYDRGYRAKGGQRIPAADADFLSGPADMVQIATRKLFAARMISAREPGYAPAPATDFERIQVLIAEARSRINTANDVMRRLLVVSAKELNQRTYAEQRVSQAELLKARNAAVEAAKKALVALPIPLPKADSSEEQRERAWDLLVAKPPAPQNRQAGMPPGQDAPVLPVRFEEGKRITLVNEHFCRVALTDSGMEDPEGRHLFYQEEWVTRPGSLARTTGTGPAGIVVLLRRAVAVNTKTGQHTLLRRYEAREFQGDFDDIYRFQESDYIANAELPQRSAPPSMQELTSDMVLAERSRKDLNDAMLDFSRQIRDGLARNDVLLAAENKFPLDDELPGDLRASLFAIRGHLAGATAILDPENRVRLAVTRAGVTVRELEALVAWVDGTALEQATAANVSRALLEAQNRSDILIHSIRALERDAIAALPPDLSTPEAQFPAFRRDLIVRIRSLGKPAAASGTTRCKQEIWRLEGSAGGAREVKRTMVFVDVDLKSGNQITTDWEVKHYPFEAGDNLEEIYDENAAQ